MGTWSTPGTRAQKYYKIIPVLCASALSVVVASPEMEDSRRKNRCHYTHKFKVIARQPHPSIWYRVWPLILDSKKMFTKRGLTMYEKQWVKSIILLSDQTDHLFNKHLLSIYAYNSKWMKEWQQVIMLQNTSLHLSCILARLCFAFTNINVSLLPYCRNS